MWAAFITRPAAIGSEYLGGDAPCGIDIRQGGVELENVIRAKRCDAGDQCRVRPGTGGQRSIIGTMTQRSSSPRVSGGLANSSTGTI
jgi:hypothetical protein